MKGLLFFTIITGVFAAGAGAVAQDDPAPMPADAQAFCDRIDGYFPFADVAYAPDVDVNGNPVVSVDLGSIDDPAMPPVSIPVELDLQTYFNLGGAAADVAGLDLRPDVAEIVVYNDGRVLYNGQDVGRRILFECHRHELDGLTRDVQPSDSKEVSNETLPEAEGSIGAGSVVDAQQADAPPVALVPADVQNAPVTSGAAVQTGSPQQVQPAKFKGIEDVTRRLLAEPSKPAPRPDPDAIEKTPIRSTNPVANPQDDVIEGQYP
ncbi:MAG: hypothetical protein ACPGRX_03165 [Bdellovibrionales bacterium]